MSDSNEANADNQKQKAKEAPSASSPVKRGRPAKEPPPPKLWRVVGESPEGVKITLGRYVTREEAEPELARMREDGFYDKLRMIDGARTNDAQAAAG